MEHRNEIPKFGRKIHFVGLEVSLRFSMMSGNLKHDCTINSTRDICPTILSVLCILPSTLTTLGDKENEMTHRRP